MEDPSELEADRGGGEVSKKFRVVLQYGDGSTTVRANWFRITWMSNKAIFYRGLRKVAYVEYVRIVREVEDE
jgi:hypothetical protein